MKYIDDVYLESILKQLTVVSRSIDMSEYTIPKGKRLLLLSVNDEQEDDILNIVGVAVHDGAGETGDRDLLELCGGDDIVFDTFFDDCHIDLKRVLKLIDDPFTK